MADIEPRVDKLEHRVTELELRTDRVITKLDMFIEESREARARQDADMRTMQAKHDADMREIRQAIDGMGKHVRNMSIVTIIGVATIVVAVLLK